MLARVLAVMGAIAVGFLLFMLLTSNPFARLLPNPPAEGSDLNPLLQDPGMVIHPPMLYFGYVGFSVAFAFAIAALWSGRLDAAWARWSRPWSIVAWMFLSIGITLGSWWAYSVLGWGGWWFWDPVENASFMPWLVGTALIHSLAVTDKRGAFKSWTVLLAIFAFSLSLLGTFLVRSGVLTSVHSFAADPARGVFILAFLAVVIGGSLTLYALRAPVVVSTAAYRWFSREIFLLLNNILLLVAALTVLSGTLFPLAVDALHLGKYSVGPPYFNAVFVPLMSILLVFMGIGPSNNWKGGHAQEILRRLLPALIASVLVGVIFPFAYSGHFHWGVVLTVCLAGWVLFSSVVDLHSKRAMRLRLSLVWKRLPAGVLRHANRTSWICRQRARRRFNHRLHRGARLAPGGRRAYTTGGIRFSICRHRTDSRAELYSRARTDAAAARRQSAHRIASRETPLQRAPRSGHDRGAIDAGLSRDIYVALGEPLENGAWAVRLHFKPFVRWIWLGGLLMAIGGALTVADRRYRMQRKEAVDTAVVVPSI